MLTDSYLQRVPGPFSVAFMPSWRKLVHKKSKISSDYDTDGAHLMEKLDTKAIEENCGKSKEPWRFRQAGGPQGHVFEKKKRF